MSAIKDLFTNLVFGGLGTGQGQGGNPPYPPPPVVAVGSDNDEILEPGAELHHLEKDETLPGKPSPLGRLKASLPYWRATMHRLGLVCALTLSIIADGYRLDWDPKEGIPPPVTLPNKQTALKEAAFVSKAIAEGVAAGVMRPCRRDALTCILPLQVAFNSAGKPRLVWDGTHVNKHLPDVKFRMETLQREGRDLFERAAWGGTVDISSAYHHIHMHESSIPFLGFEWEGSYYAYTVLPFGLSTAPWIFTLVMSHCVRFLRSTGVELIAYLDDLIFAHATPREALQRISGQPIRPRPLDGRFNGDIFSDASDLGVGAYIATSGPDARPASSSAEGSTGQPGMRLRPGRGRPPPSR